MSAEGHQRAKLRLGTDLTRQVDLALLFILWDGAEVVGPMLGRTKPVLQFRRKFVALAQSAHAARFLQTSLGRTENIRQNS